MEPSGYRKERLDATFAALSDPTRRAILARLRQGSATVNELAEPFGITQQAISKHLNYLERAQLIAKEKQGRTQLCTLHPLALKEAADWIEDYRLCWNEAFDRLDELLHDLKNQRQPAGTKHASKKH